LLPGPMTTGFVFWSLAIVASSKPRWALTSSGGVRASHCRCGQFGEKKIPQMKRTLLKLISSNIAKCIV